MARIYISSTYRDLREHRRLVANTLERCGHSTHAMEQYFASDERSLTLCLTDLAQCDLYVGIFAWRYGFIPLGVDCRGSSITECEFREAIRLRIPTLVFLSDDGPEQWPDSDPDNLERVRALREELAATATPGYFNSSDRLATEVSVAVNGWLRKPRLKSYMQAVLSESLELPLLPNRVKNLSLSEIIPPFVTVPVSPNSKEPRSCALLDAMRQERAFFLVGEAGQGKSTALQYLAWHCAQHWLEQHAGEAPNPEDDLIPIRLELGRQASGLCTQAWEAMQRQGFSCSEDLFNEWIKRHQFLFLFDRHDQSDPRSVIDQCRVLLQRTPQSRIVIASRPLQILESSEWPQRRLEPLTPETLKNFLTKLTTPSRGMALAQALDNNHLTDVFRRPLFARLIALSTDAITAGQNVSLTRLFDDVVSNGFLGHWEGQGESTLSLDMVRTFLAYCGYQMLKTEQFIVTRSDAARHAAKIVGVVGLAADFAIVDELLRRVVLHGLMRESAEGLSFWHSSFRDYFAAVWLARHATSVPVYRLSHRSEWHDCLVFYFGLLQGTAAARQLRRLVSRLWFDMWLLRRLPSPMSADRLLLVLRCLVECGAGEAVSPRVTARLPQRLDSLNLSNATVPASWIRHNRNHDSACRYLLYLVRQLRSTAAMAYLQSVVCPLDVLAPALVDGADYATVCRFVSALSGNPGAERLTKHGNEVMCEWILNSTDIRYRQEIHRVFQDASNEGRSALMWTLSGWLGRNGDGSGDETMRSELSHHWENSLTFLALTDDDAQVRDSAISLLNRLAGGQYRLSATAERTFMNALSATEPQARKRAWRAVNMSSFEGYDTLRWTMLGDADLSIVFEALFNFHVFGRRGRLVCRAILRVIRRLTISDVVTRQAARDMTTYILKEKLECAYPRVVGLLMASAEHCAINGLRLYALRGLSVCRYPWMVEWLTQVLRQETWNEARCSALDIAVDLLGKEATPVISEALHDQDERVRGHAAALCCMAAGRHDWIPHVRTRLFAMLGDSKEYPRRYAMMALKDHNLLKKDWYPSKGEAVPEDDLTAQDSSIEAGRER
jgi:hypothetical protein